MSEPRRPVWAAAGTFPAAWDGTAQLARKTPASPDKVPPVHALLASLSIANIIRFDQAQMDALPEASDQQMHTIIRTGRPPFSSTYLSLGDRMGAAVLSDTTDDGMGLVVWAFRHFEAHPVPNETDLSWLMPVMQARYDGVNVRLSPIHKQFNDAVGALMGEYREFCVQAVRYAATALYFLESANVELVDTPVSRQERRAAERKGGRVTLTVHVRTPKRRLRSDPSGHHIDYSHRFEVRGHYKHFPVGTKLADSAPTKLVTHPTLGQCRRIWCPPFVKGPEDKPLIPKVRIIQ
jgi:hypothetical protein